MKDSHIYLDYNATAPLLPAARDAIVDALDQGFGNASSSHWAGRLSHELMAQARQRVAALVAAAPEEVTFTSGATEALTQVLWTVGPGRIVLSAVEHPAIFGAARNLGARELDIVPVRPFGPIDPDEVLARVDDGPPPVLVAVMAANNVTGILNPVAALIAPLRERGVPLLIDAVQQAGKLPLPFGAEDQPHDRPDYLVITGHKIGGPKGVGALITRSGVPLRPLLEGGGQEQGRRAGTEPIPLLAGFGAAAAAVRSELPAMSARYASLRDRLQGALIEALPGAFAVGAEVPRLPNTLNLVLPEGCEAAATMARLDQLGIAVSAGSACHAGSAEPSAVLLATGLSASEALRALRISLGHATTEAEIARVIELLPKAAREVGR